jgi:hypothetical protein
MFSGFTKYFTKDTPNGTQQSDDSTSNPSESKPTPSEYNKPTFNPSNESVGYFGAKAGLAKRFDNSLKIYSIELQTLNECATTSEAFLDYIAKYEKTDIDEELVTERNKIGDIYKKHYAKLNKLVKEFNGYNNKEDIALLNDIQQFYTLEDILKKLATIQKALFAADIILNALFKIKYDFSTPNKYINELLEIPLIKYIYEHQGEYKQYVDKQNVESTGGRPRRSRRQKSKRRQLSKRRSSSRRSKK